MYHYNAYWMECVAHGLDVQMHVHHILFYVVCVLVQVCLHLFISAVLSFNHNFSIFHMCFNSFWYENERISLCINIIVTHGIKYTFIMVGRIENSFRSGEVVMMYCIVQVMKVLFLFFSYIIEKD